MKPALPWRSVHFTGIGGVGMAGMALILRDFGVAVSGSDAEESKNLALLRQRGATIFVGHRAEQVRQPDLLVYSSAVQPDNPEWRAAVAQGVRCVRRGDYLAELAQFFPRRVAVAGSHGKTTTTAMISHILLVVGWQPGYLVGGEVAGRALPASAGKGEILVTEVDESDGTQAAMHSTHGVVLNAEDDHCWSLGGEERLRQIFRDFAAKADYLVTVESPETRALFASHPQVEFITPAMIRQDLRLLVPGLHNRSNATVALRVATKLGVPESEAVAALGSFTGVDRRLTLRHAGPAVLVVEDYAHHPSELRASLAALREAHPGRRLRVLFQPHRYERVARYAKDFATELSLADEVVVTAPFGAWLNDSHLASAQVIVDQIQGPPARYTEEAWDHLGHWAATSAQANDLWVIMGAGSITKTTPVLVADLKARSL